MSETTRTPRLLIRSKNGASEELELAETSLTIGRRPDNHLVLDDPTVSGHHARITKIQAAYFIEDLKSTNGTQVNGQRTDRRQLQDADVIAIGHFRLVYRGDQIANSVRPAATNVDVEHTMAFTGQILPETLKKASSCATLHVVAGGTNQDRYELTGQVTVIGAKHDATIPLTGWFAPKVAALIVRRGGAYVLTPSGSGRKIRINDQAVTGPLQLEDGDRIEVGGLILRFSCKAEQKAA